MCVRAVVLDDPVGGPCLRELPIPEPKANEILVNVRASSVNGVDGAIATGGLLASMEHEFPIVLGHDFAGVVDRVGSEATLFSEGDDVFGFIARSRLDASSGTWADYIVVPEDRFVARKPATLGFVQSGALPLAGVAALMAVDAVDPQPGETILVVGATGGVGGYVVELASARGSTVMATATVRDAARLIKLGARETIDHTVGDIAASIRARIPSLHVLVDLVSDAEQFGTLAAMLVPGGRAATTLGVAAAVLGSEIQTTNVFASPEPELLTRLARSADSGHLRPTIANIYPLGEAQEALEEFAGGTHGKITLLLANGQ
jgi:NADPH:quinone reductase-like Zn-dependent oxidoreductase